MTITNSAASSLQGNGVGLFSVLAGASISNLTLTGIRITNNQSDAVFAYGILAGLVSPSNQATNVENIIITDSLITGPGIIEAGGLVALVRGYGAVMNLTNAIINVDITVKQDVGGIASRVDTSGRLNYHDITIDGLTNGSNTPREFVFSTSGGTTTGSGILINNTDKP